MVKALWQLDRWLLAVYMIAVFGLLTFPLAGPEFRLFGIEADKWMHVALFGGLAVLLRWNVHKKRPAVVYAIAAAILVAAATELVQGLIAYRSPDFMDLLAGTIGAVLGAAFMDRMMLSPAFQRLVGFLVAIAGLMISAFFLMADVIGVGDNRFFGMLQIAGTALGATIALGGVWAYLMSLRATRIEN